MVGAVINQAREGLIGAAIADVGVMDLLKVRPAPPQSLRVYIG
jgi:hypothetical protein